MKLQQKILAGFIALIPSGCLISNLAPNLFHKTADDAGPGLVMISGFLISGIGCLGILGCALFWKWDPK